MLKKSKINVEGYTDENVTVDMVLNSTDVKEVDDCNKEVALKEEQCLHILKELKYKDGFECGICGGNENNLFYQRGRATLRCKCGKEVNVRERTIFKGKGNFYKWFDALVLYNENRGVKEKEIVSKLGVSYNTAHSMIEAFKKAYHSNGGTFYEQIVERYTGVTDPLKNLPYYYRTPQYGIIFADMYEILRMIPDGFFDAVICDPPYEETDEVWDKLDIPRFLKEIIRVLKPNGSMIIFSGGEQAPVYMNILKKLGFNRTQCIWNKVTESNKPKGNGRNKIIANAELFFHCYRKGYDERRTFNKVNGKNPLRCITHPVVSIKDSEHTTPKPVDLLKKFVMNVTNKGDYIFDPFMGGGSLGVAAIELNRKYLGVDFILEHCEISKKRLDKAQNEVLNNKVGGTDNV